MVFDKDGTTTIVFQENVSLKKFMENLVVAYPDIKHGNIIVNLFAFPGLTAGDISGFLQLSKTHRKAKKSFVLVTDKVAYDNLPDEINVVPTLQEAKDVIEMEEIERDLGL